MNLECCNPEAQRVILAAQQIAWERGRSAFWAEDLLLAILRDADCTAARLLASLGQQVTLLTLFPWPPPADTPRLASGPAALTMGASATLVLTYALAAARLEGLVRIGTEHILIGLATDPSTTVGRALLEAGADEQVLRERLRQTFHAWRLSDDEQAELFQELGSLAREQQVRRDAIELGTAMRRLADALAQNRAHDTGSAGDETEREALLDRLWPVFTASMTVAHEYGARLVAPHHVLLACAEQQEALRLLEHAGASRVALQAAVYQRFPPPLGRRGARREGGPAESEAVQALRWDAVAAARGMGQAPDATHLLLAVAESYSAAAEVIDGLGLDGPTIRRWLNDDRGRGALVEVA